MNIQSLVISVFVSFGVFTVFSTLGGKIALEYTYAAFTNLNIGAASNAPKIIKASLFLGVLAACFTAIGFANKARANAIQKAIYALFIAVPVVIWATYPELKSFYLDSKEITSLIYHTAAAIVGLYLGLRFNGLKKI